MSSYSTITIVNSAACAIVTISFIIIYFICLFRYKKMRQFLSSLYCALFVTDIGAIVTSATRESASSISQCGLSQALNYFFIMSYFLFTSLMVIFLLVLLSRKKIWFLSGLNEVRLNQVIFHSIGWGTAIILVSISITNFPPDFDPETGACASSFGFKMFLYGVWLVTTVFNASSLFYLYIYLKNLSRMASSERYSLRIILSIAAIVGGFRVPSFILLLSTNMTVVEMLEYNLALGIFGLIASALTVLQSTFVVLVILFNNHILKCGCCSSGAGSSTGHNSSEIGKSPEISNRKSVEVSLSVVANENE